MKKLYKCFKKDKRVKFALHYETTKLSHFTNTKGQISLLIQSPVVYKFVCPGCRSSYIEKRECTLWERTEEHAYKNINQKEQSAIYEHLLIYEHYNHIVDLFNVDNNSLTTWISLINAKSKITQLLLIKQITGTFYFSRKHIWIKHKDPP